MKELAGPTSTAALATPSSSARRRPGGGPDIRLLSARKLIAHIDGGGKMATRQALERMRDLYLDKTVRAPPELGPKDGERCTFSSWWR